MPSSLLKAFHFYLSNMLKLYFKLINHTMCMSQGHYKILFCSFLTCPYTKRGKLASRFPTFNKTSNFVRTIGSNENKSRIDYHPFFNNVIVCMHISFLLQDKRLLLCVSKKSLKIFFFKSGVCRKERKI